SARQSGEVVLELNALAGPSKPRRADLGLRRGEVFGIAGLMGAGRTELLRTIFGLDAIKGGRVRVGAYVGPASPARRWAQGVGILSEDRKVEGLALKLSIGENLTLSNMTTLGPAGLVFPSQRDSAARNWIG